MNAPVKRAKSTALGRKCNKNKKRIAFRNKEHTISRKSETQFDCFFICDTVICEAAYAP